MKYEIISQSDSLSGMRLTVQIPEEELDRKALYTVQHVMPNFLVPFQNRSVDGKEELIYRLDGRSKLRYYSGQHSPDEYVRFWETLLQPLLDCDDWFLKPFSFVLDPDYLYRNRDESVSYLYIPTVENCSDHEDLRGMVASLAKSNGVSDPELENVVLRMLVQDFQPRSFLEALRKHVSARKAVEYPPQPIPVPDPAPTPAPIASPKPTPETPPHDDSAGRKAPPAPGDIHLDWEEPSKKGKRKSFSFFGGKGKDGDESKHKEKQKKKDGEKRSAEEKMTPATPQGSPRGSSVSGQVQEPPPSVRAQPVEENETQLEEFGTCLRLVGLADLPAIIPVDIQVQGMFTIGRVDKTVSHKQSDFEFPPETKAVSRRHAVIERDVDGYTITDLTSRAGTFVNGTAIHPNAPYRLRPNTRISFGTSGADYIWEEG